MNRYPDYIKASAALYLAAVCCCLIVERPKNSIGVVDKVVIIPCSVDTIVDVVDWYFRGINGRMIQISRGFTIVNQRFDTMRILYESSNNLIVRYDLMIRNLNLNYSGTYCCSVISRGDRSIYMASLSMFVVERCDARIENNLFIQNCIFKSSGKVIYSLIWHCTRQFKDTTASRIEESKNLFSEVIKVNMVIQSTVISLRNQKNLTACVLDVKADEMAQHSADNIDEDVPRFHISIFLTSTGPPHLFRSDLEICKPRDDGTLVLRTEIAFSEQYLQKNQLLSDDMYFVSYSCQLLPDPTSRSPTTRQDSYFQLVAGLNCEEKNALACYENFTYFIQPSSNMLYLTRNQFRYICSERNVRHVQKCLDLRQPCTPTQRMLGIQSSYEFLCSSNYETISQPLKHVNSQSCNEHYPQIMGTLYAKNLVRPSVRDLPMANSTAVNGIFCRHMSAISEIFCIEHLIASNGNVDLSYWYLKFVGLLKQLDHYTLNPEYDGYSKISLFGCENENSNIVTRTICFESQNCTPSFSMLLQSTTFGFVLVQNYRKLETEVCSRYELELRSCLSNFFEHCDLNTYFIYRPMVALKEALCGKYKKAYQQHESCFMRYYVSSEIHQHCSWSSEFYELYAFRGSQAELSRRMCRMGRQHVNCVYNLVAMACGREAGRLQKALLNTILGVAFEKLSCRNLFSSRAQIRVLSRTSSAEWFMLRSRFRFNFICTLLLVGVVRNHIAGTGN